MTWSTQGVDLETFESLDQETRSLVLRVLDDPQESDFQDLHNHPNGKMLASWLLELPSYANAYETDATTQDGAAA